MDPLRRAIGLQKLSLLLTAIGFIGLGVSAGIRMYLGLRDEEFMASVPGSIAVFIFSGLFILGLVVLFPVSVFMQRKAEGQVNRDRIPRWGWFLVPFGMADPGWEMPQWIAWPVRLLLFVLLTVVLLLMVGLVLVLLFGGG